MLTLWEDKTNEEKLAHLRGLRRELVAQAKREAHTSWSGRCNKCIAKIDKQIAEIESNFCVQKAPVSGEFVT